MDNQTLDPDHFATLGAGFMLSGQGTTYSVDEARPWLAQASWRFAEHRPLAGVTSVVIAEAI